MAKAADAFRTISEVADDLGIPKHVLRFWEVKFSQIRPMKRGGGRRYYRPQDMDLLRGIRFLLHRDGYTIKGVQKILREQGVDIVKARGRGNAGPTTDTDGTPLSDEPLRGAAAIGDAVPNPISDEIGKAEDRTPAVIRERLVRAAISELEACRRLLRGEPTHGDLPLRSSTTGGN